ncbi:hypothetical protein [Streptomyces sp. NPDC058457]|uniref:hypothetical protein n=1 Tax=Streptomyces sp. NPDC058457 TaxID=3346507 RepID=UPI003652D9DA
MLACRFGVDRSTITRAIGEVRPLLAERGCTVTAGVRLRTAAEVVDHLGVTGQTGIVDGTEMHRTAGCPSGKADRTVGSVPRPSGRRRRQVSRTVPRLCPRPYACHVCREREDPRVRRTDGYLTDQLSNGRSRLSGTICERGGRSYRAGGLNQDRPRASREPQWPTRSEWRAGVPRCPPADSAVRAAARACPAVLDRLGHALDDTV